MTNDKPQDSEGVGSARYMSPETALHEAGYVVLAETFGYLTLVYYLGEQDVSIYYYNGDRLIRETTPPLCVIGMGGYAAELLFSDGTDLAGCAYDLEQVTDTYDERFVNSLLSEVCLSSREAVDALARGLTDEQRSCLYIAYDKLASLRQACLETARKLQRVPTGAKWSNDITNRIWQEPGGKVRYGNVQSNDTNF